MKQFFHSNGKLLLSGEYFVLDGAIALGLPAKFGQSLEVESWEMPYFRWESYNKKGECWFWGEFDLKNFDVLRTNDVGVAQVLRGMLAFAFQGKSKQIKATTQLEFPRNWGLGSSSTLLCNIAKWSGVDAFELSKNTLGGSGYDIACGMANGSILYQIIEGKPTAKPIDFSPSFKSNIYFVHLGKKQNSREGIKRYRAKVKEDKSLITTVNDLTEGFLKATNLETFENLIIEHEKLVAQTIKLPRAKALYFTDYWGEVKSLGAWGGDFVMVTSKASKDETKAYFHQKGFTDFLTYKEMIL